MSISKRSRFIFSLRTLCGITAIFGVLCAAIAAESTYSAKLERIAMLLHAQQLTVTTTTTSLWLCSGVPLFYRIQGVIANNDDQWRTLIQITPPCRGIGIRQVTATVGDICRVSVIANCEIISIRDCTISIGDQETLVVNRSVREVRYDDLDAAAVAAFRERFPCAKMVDN